LYESHNLTAGGDQGLAVARALATTGKEGRQADPVRPPPADDDTRLEIGEVQGRSVTVGETCLVRMTRLQPTAISALVCS
jgi:hypothetical protein